MRIQLYLRIMKWIFLILLPCLCDIGQCRILNENIVNNEQKLDDRPWHEINYNEIFDYPFEKFPDYVDNSEDHSSNTSINTTRSEEESIQDILKALDLPRDFLDVTKVESNQNTQTTDSIKPQMTSVTKLADTKTDTELYMTGSSTLDRIMRCPCHHHQLAPLGIHGYVYHHPTSHGYSYSTGHGHGHGQNHLHLEVGTKATMLGHLVKLLLSIPHLKLTLLKPLILGLVDTTAQATLSVAELKAHAAKHLPGVVRVKAEVLKKLVETFGDATGSILYVLSQLLYSAAVAKKSFAEILPYALEVLTHKSEYLTSALGTVAFGLSDTTNILSHGVTEAAKAKGKLVTTLLEGSHHFKQGVLDGIKHDVHHVHHDGGWSQGPSQLHHHFDHNNHLDHVHNNHHNHNYHTDYPPHEHPNMQQHPHHHHGGYNMNDWSR